MRTTEETVSGKERAGSCRLIEPRSCSVKSEMVRLQMQHGNVYVQRREQISKVQKDKSQSHLAEQNTKSMDSYRSNQGRVFEGNAASKKTGVDRTVHIEKKVLFSDVVQKCKTPPHFDNLKLELAARGIHHSVNPKVKELKDLLKQDEKNKWISENLGVDESQRDKTGFKALTGNEKFARPDKYNDADDDDDDADEWLDYGGGGDDEGDGDGERGGGD